MRGLSALDPHAQFIDQVPEDLVLTFDEALAVLIKGHPDQKRLLQGANQDGSGGQGGGDGGDTGGTITRADYEKLPHDQRREVLKTKKLVDA